MKTLTTPGWLQWITIHVSIAAFLLTSSIPLSTHAGSSATAVLLAQGSIDPLGQRVDQFQKGTATALMLGAGPEQLPELLDRANELQRQLDEAGHPAADDFRNRVTRPLGAIGRTITRLKQCDREDLAGVVGRGLLAAADADPCNGVNLPDTLRELTDRVSDANRVVNPDRPEDVRALRDLVVQQTRRNIIGLEQQVRSQMTEPIPADPNQQLDQIYRRIDSDNAADAASDPELTEALRRIANGQPTTGEQRRDNRRRLFDQTNQQLQSVRRLNDDIRQLEQSSQALWDITHGEWARQSPVTPDMEMTARALASHHQAVLEGREKPVFIVPQGTNPRTIVLPADSPYSRVIEDPVGYNPAPLFVQGPAGLSGQQVLNPVERLLNGPGYTQPFMQIAPQPRAQPGTAPGYAVAKLFEERYGVRFGNRPPNPFLLGVPAWEALARDLERVYPGMGLQMAAQVIRHLDNRLGVTGVPVNGVAHVRTGVSPTEAVWLTQEALQSIKLANDQGGIENAAELATNSLARQRALLLRVQGELRQNPLVWQPQVGDQRIRNGISSPLSDDVLNEALQSYYDTSDQLLETIEDQADDDARDFLKSALKNNPQAVAQALTAHPEYTLLVCSLSNELIDDAESESKWDTFWMVTGIVVGVGLVVVTGGLALAGYGTAALVVGGSVGLAYTGASLTRNVVKMNELNHEAETARRYLHGLGVGNPERIDYLYDRASHYMWGAVMDGALAPIEVFAFFRGIRALRGAAALRALEDAASGSEQAIRAAQRLGGKVGDPATRQFVTRALDDIAAGRALNPADAERLAEIAAANGERVPLIFSNTDNLDEIMASQRYFGNTEGAAYGARLPGTTRWRRVLAGHHGEKSGRIIFQGEAATNFTAHEIEGFYSGAKRLAGQQKGPFGDLVWDIGSATRQGNTIIVTQATRGAHASQTAGQALTRLWGRRIGIEALGTMSAGSVTYQGYVLLDSYATATGRLTTEQRRQVYIRLNGDESEGGSNQ